MSAVWVGMLLQAVNALACFALLVLIAHSGRRPWRILCLPPLFVGASYLAMRIADREPWTPEVVLRGAPDGRGRALVKYTKLDDTRTQIDLEIWRTTAVDRRLRRSVVIADPHFHAGYVYVHWQAASHGVALLKDDPDLPPLLALEFEP